MRLAGQVRREHVQLLTREARTFSLLEASDERQICMHRLVQDALRRRLEATAGENS